MTNGVTMTTLLERAIKSLSIVVNVATGLTHPLDESQAKELFIALLDAGVQLERSEVKSIALVHGWSDRHANALADLAERIGSGSRVVIKAPRGWGQRTVERLQSEVIEGG